MESAVIEPKTKPKGFFSPANAKLYAQQSKEVRQQRKELAALSPADKLKAGLPEPETYEERELRFMREEISRTREQMSAETDPDLKFKLGCTLKKDWEIEQLLSNRPGPGTRKPKAEPTRKANQSCDPVDE